MKQQLFTRSAGILLPVSSLPSPYGIGSLGKSARKWIDFLKDAGQSFWQVLPMGPTDSLGSPYSSPSAFAGDPCYIDLDILREDGLLDRADYESLDWGKTGKRVVFHRVKLGREAALRKALSRFKNESALDEFAGQNTWVSNYSRYMETKTLSEPAGYHTFVQYQFMRQWKDMHEYALSKGVRIIGDIPIYVSLDSADVWANPGLFQLDKDSVPIEVSGCPPDKFADGGQVWNNPLYDWKTIKKNGYKWWIERLRHSFELYDVLRIDHFRGLVSYFAIPEGEKTAENGKWKPGPGKDFIDAVKKSMPEASIIAEDLGYITKAVRELVSYSGYPNMKVLQFAFDTRAKGKDYMPDTYGANTVVYPGTHDNDTLKGWCKTAPGASIKKAMAYLNVRRASDLPLAMIRLAMQCNSYLAIIPMQDWLELGSSARMNTPSTVSKKNWSWRIEEEALTEDLAQKIYEITVSSDRLSSL